MTDDAPPSLTEEELARWGKDWQAEVYRNRGPVFVARAQFGLRLVAEVRRLRQSLDATIDVERANLEAAEKHVYAMVVSEEAALAYCAAQGRYNVLQELRQRLMGQILEKPGLKGEE